MPPVNSQDSSVLVWQLDDLIVDDELRNSRIINDHQNVDNQAENHSADLIPTTVIEKEEETTINLSVSWYRKH
jgi:hypothetical protein